MGEGGVEMLQKERRSERLGSSTMKIVLESEWGDRTLPQITFTGEAVSESNYLSDEDDERKPKLPPVKLFTREIGYKQRQWRGVEDEDKFLISPIFVDDKRENSSWKMAQAGLATGGMITALDQQRVTRREFLKKLAVGGLALFLASIETDIAEINKEERLSEVLALRSLIILNDTWSVLALDKDAPVMVKDDLYSDKLMSLVASGVSAEQAKERLFDPVYFDTLLELVDLHENIDGVFCYSIVRTRLEEFKWFKGKFIKDKIFLEAMRKYFFIPTTERGYPWKSLYTA